MRNQIIITLLFNSYVDVRQSIWAILVLLFVHFQSDMVLMRFMRLHRVIITWLLVLVFAATLIEGKDVFTLNRAIIFH